MDPRFGSYLSFYHCVLPSGNEVHRNQKSWGSTSNGSQVRHTKVFQVFQVVHVFQMLQVYQVLHVLQVFQVFQILGQVPLLPTGVNSCAEGYF